MQQRTKYQFILKSQFYSCVISSKQEQYADHITYSKSCGISPCHEKDLSRTNLLVMYRQIFYSNKWK